MGIPWNGEMEAVVTDAPWLMEMAVAADWRHRLPKISLTRHVDDIKNIAGDDQATIRVDRNSANIAHTLKI